MPVESDVEVLRVHISELKAGDLVYQPIGEYFYLVNAVGKNTEGDVVLDVIVIPSLANRKHRLKDWSDELRTIYRMRRGVC